jgi:hypothetical protein
MIIYSTKEIIFASIISKYSQSNADIKHIWDKIKHQVKSHTNNKLIPQHLIFNTILKWHKSHI